MNTLGLIRILALSCHN